MPALLFCLCWPFLDVDFLLFEVETRYCLDTIYSSLIIIDVYHPSIAVKQDMLVHLAARSYQHCFKLMMEICSGRSLVS